MRPNRFHFRRPLRIGYILDAFPRDVSFQGRGVGRIGIGGTRRRVLLRVHASPLLLINRDNRNCSEDRSDGLLHWRHV